MPQSEVHPASFRVSAEALLWHVRLHYLQQEQQQTATMATTTASSDAMEAFRARYEAHFGWEVMNDLINKVRDADGDPTHMYIK